MALQMFFRILKNRGFAASEAYRVARWAIRNRTTLNTALASQGYSWADIVAE